MKIMFVSYIRKNSECNIMCSYFSSLSAIERKKVLYSIYLKKVSCLREFHFREAIAFYGVVKVSRKCPKNGPRRC